MVAGLNVISNNIASDKVFLLSSSFLPTLDHCPLGLGGH